MSMKKQQGFGMIEVMVTFVIVAMGLLGMNALQSATVQNGFEAYQRALLISIVDDMAARIRMNPNNSEDYLNETGAYYGSNAMSLVSCQNIQGSERDKCEWNQALKGRYVVDPVGAGLAAPYGARGCIELLDTNTVQISVAWMGISKQVSPEHDCGYGDMPEDNRRVITREIKIK